MARGKTLNELVEAVKFECRRSTDSSRGIGNRDYIVQIVKRTYETLWDEHDWPMARAIRDITLAAGQYRYDFPADMDYENIRKVRTLDGNVWIPVDQGVDDRQYTHIDPESDERSSPVLRWDMIDAGAGDQIEVWPMPDSAGTLRLRGLRNRSDLVADDDRADIDSLVIILSAAATIYADSGQKASAEARQAAAGRRLARIKSRNASKRVLNMAEAGDDRYADNYGKQYIPRAVYNDRTP